MFMSCWLRINKNTAYTNNVIESQNLLCLCAMQSFPKILSLNTLKCEYLKFTFAVFAYFDCKPVFGPYKGKKNHVTVSRKVRLCIWHNLWSDNLFWLTSQKQAVSYWTLKVTILSANLHESEDYCRYSFYVCHSALVLCLIHWK